MNRKITLIDGGMGQELIHRSKIKPDYLWSARVLLDHYGLVVDLHKDFINSGAEAITLNSYTITPDRLKKFNLEDSFKPLQESAIKAAKEAINSFSSFNKLTDLKPFGKPPKGLFNFFIMLID